MKPKLTIKLGEGGSAPEMLVETVVDMSCNEDSIRASTTAHQQVSCVAYDSRIDLERSKPWKCALCVLCNDIHIVGTMLKTKTLLSFPKALKLNL